jgi:hypothetical protein
MVFVLVEPSRAIGSSLLQLPERLDRKLTEKALAGYIAALLDPPPPEIVQAFSPAETCSKFFLVPATLCDYLRLLGKGNGLNRSKTSAKVRLCAGAEMCQNLILSWPELGINWLFMPRTPEEKARQTIDTLLQQAGWTVQNREDANIDAARGVAIREFSLGH